LTEVLLQVKDHNSLFIVEAFLYWWVC